MFFEVQTVSVQLEVDLDSGLCRGKVTVSFL